MVSRVEYRLAGVGVLFFVASIAPALHAQDFDELPEDDAEAQPSDDSAVDDVDSGGAGADDGTGIHFGLRLAYAFPMGSVYGSSNSTTTIGGVTQTRTVEAAKLSEGVAGQIPIWLDLGWQVTPAFMAGAYFSYGVVLPAGDLADLCDDGDVSCTLNDIRLGVQAQLSLSPGRSVDPWIGAGAGYEWLSLKVDETTVRYRGTELFMLQGGLDFGGDSDSTTYGLFAAFTFGQFAVAHQKMGNSGESRDVENQALHNWLFLGVRGAMK